MKSINRLVVAVTVLLLSTRAASLGSSYLTEVLRNNDCVACYTQYSNSHFCYEAAVNEGFCCPTSSNANICSSSTSGKVCGGLESQMGPSYCGEYPPRKQCGNTETL